MTELRELKAKREAIGKHLGHYSHREFAFYEAHRLRSGDS